MLMVDHPTPQVITRRPTKLRILGILGYRAVGSLLVGPLQQPGRPISLKLKAHVPLGAEARGSALFRGSNKAVRPLLQVASVIETCRYYLKYSSPSPSLSLSYVAAVSINARSTLNSRSRRPSSQQPWGMALLCGGRGRQHIPEGCAPSKALWASCPVTRGCMSSGQFGM
jgi:hypothetical protein